MDAKITKKRLSGLLSYDWLKILGLIAGIIIIWSLIFTMTATKITPMQQFTVFNHYANVSLDAGKFYDRYDDALKDGVFSYEVIEADYVDLAMTKDNVSEMCSTRFATGQGDMMFIPNILDTDWSDEKTKIYYPESFLANYWGYLLDWDEYMTSARKYLDSYFYGEYENEEVKLNEEKAEKNFRARVEKSRDKRFRREKNLKQGIKDEFARLNKYREGFVQFEKYLADGVIKLENVEYKDLSTGEAYEENGKAIRGNYILNICPDESKMNRLKEQVYYSVKMDDGTKKASAQDMCVMIFSLPDMDEIFQYETVLYINSVIESSMTK